MSLPMPEHVPETGFYYHYKHDPDGPIGNYAYEVMGVGFHTEDDTRPGEEHFLVYRPLYEAAIYIASLGLDIPCFDARPLTMWMSNVEHKGQIVPRFQLIVDPVVVSELEKIRTRMYGLDM